MDPDGTRGGLLSQFQVRGICLALLPIALLTLGACSTPSHPRYQPLPKGIVGFPYQGYHDVQIDERTYFVHYDQYFLLSFKTFLSRGSALDEMWLKGAQEYVLYRAGELTKSRGASHFVVLHKDDWNVIGSVKHKHQRSPIIYPGAGILMRVLDRPPSSVQKDEGFVYEVNTLLASLAEKNGGLAEYRGQPTSGDKTSVRNSQFSRWRSSSHRLDHVQVPSFSWFNGKFLEFNSPETTIAKMSANVFEVVILSRSWISPLQMLWQCVEIARQEGYEVFRLEEWTVDQYGETFPWFRTKATVVLQHQLEPESLLPVFEVEKIRASVDTPDRFNRKYSGETLEDIRYGNIGK